METEIYQWINEKITLAFNSLEYSEIIGLQGFGFDEETVKVQLREQLHDSNLYGFVFYTYECYSNLRRGEDVFVRFSDIFNEAEEISSIGRELTEILEANDLIVNWSGYNQDPVIIKSLQSYIRYKEKKIERKNQYNKPIKQLSLGI